MRSVRLLHVLLAGSVIMAVGVAGSGDDDWGDDDEGESPTTAPFEVDGEVRHDWGQTNLRQWDGAVLYRATRSPAGPAHVWHQYLLHCGMRAAQ
jgi:hypothetical protein